jgi:hypothetical protein
MISPPEDGLTGKWEGRVWLNPPYGPETGKWLAKLARHGDGIALIFARTETEMFIQHVWNAAASVLFIAGRLHFHDVSGKRAAANAGGPSVLVAYGGASDQRLERSGIAGQFIRLRSRFVQPLLLAPEKAVAS